jgi:hypothetical protein
MRKSVQRCPWPGEDELYCAYHDEEWGVPEYDDRALYEKLVLDGFQAGSRGSRSCASARISAKRSTISIRSGLRATASASGRG